MEEQKKPKQSFWFRLRHRLENRLIAGILIVVPLWVTYVALKFFFKSLDSFFAPILKKFLPFTVPGMGFILLLVFLYLVGLVAANIMGRSLINLWESILNRIPFVKNIYNATKQLIQTMSVSKSLGFQKVVFVEYPRKDVMTIGFVTNTVRFEKEKKKFFNVFIPNPPNPATGVVVIVPEDEVTDANMTIEEALRFVLSVGIVMPSQYTKGPESSGQIDS